MITVKAPQRDVFESFHRRTVIYVNKVQVNAISDESDVFITWYAACEIRRQQSRKDIRHISD